MGMRVIVEGDEVEDLATILEVLMGEKDLDIQLVLSRHKKDVAEPPKKKAKKKVIQTKEEKKTVHTKKVPEGEKSIRYNNPKSKETYDKILTVLRNKGAMKVSELNQYFPEKGSQWMHNRLVTLMRVEKIMKVGKAEYEIISELEDKKQKTPTKMKEDNALNIAGGTLCAYCDMMIHGDVSVINTNEGWVHKKCFDKKVKGECDGKIEKE